MNDELTLKRFDKLTKKQQDELVSKALAWFCAFDVLHPYYRAANEEEVATIKIILGKYRG